MSVLSWLITGLVSNVCPFYSRLLGEIVSMQKARAQRKRAKIMSSVTTAATTQISQFLSQCRDFAEQAATNAAQSVTKRLANLTAAADLVCDELGKDVLAAETTGAELSALCRELDQEVSVFTNEVNALAGPQFAKEEKELRAELLAMRRAAVDVVKKTIAIRYVDHGEGDEGRKKLNSKMLKQLRDL